MLKSNENKARTEIGCERRSELSHKIHNECRGQVTGERRPVRPEPSGGKETEDDSGENQRDNHKQGQKMGEQHLSEQSGCGKGWKLIGPGYDRPKHIRGRAILFDSNHFPE